MNEQIASEYLALIPTLFGSFGELSKQETGLSHMQNHVIEYIFMRKKALNLKEISAGLHIAKQQLTAIVKELESGGYVKKEPDPADKRAVLVSLTPAGKKREAEKWKAIYGKLSNDLAKLSEEERIDLHYALHKANVLLKKMEG